eukprot:15307263-Alexandrium_andersonii.AAC.1
MDGLWCQARLKHARGGEGTCPLCGLDEETTFHKLWECEKTQAVRLQAGGDIAGGIQHLPSPLAIFAVPPRMAVSLKGKQLRGSEQGEG